MTTSKYIARAIDAMSVLVLGATALIWAAARDREGVELPAQLAVDSTLVGLTVKELVVHGQYADSAVPTIGANTLVYVFSTNCWVCRSHRVQVSRALRRSSLWRVITGSWEPVEVSRQYWVQGDGSEEVSIPVVSFTPATLRELHATSGAHFILIDSSGVIRRAFSGSLTGYSDKDVALMLAPTWRR